MMVMADHCINLREKDLHLHNHFSIASALVLHRSFIEQQRIQ